MQNNWDGIKTLVQIWLCSMLTLIAVFFTYIWISSGANWNVHGGATATWHNVFRAEQDGIAIKPSKPFHLLGGRWRVTISCKSEDAETITGYLTPVDVTSHTTANFKDLVVYSPCPSKTIIYRDSEPEGEYEVSILTTAQYSVLVDDFY